MHYNCNQPIKKKSLPIDSLITAIGKAAEEEMLKEYELWELQIGTSGISADVEHQILNRKNVSFNKNTMHFHQEGKTQLFFVYNTSHNQ